MANPDPIDSPFDKRAQYNNRRSALLSEAARLFNTQGSGATTLKQVAAELSLTKTSLYYYVQTKQDLIYQCYLENCSFFDQLIAQCRSIEGPGVERVRHYVSRSIGVWREIVEGNHPHIAILDSNDALPMALRREISQRYGEHFNALVELVREGTRDGSIVDADPVYIAVAINGAVTWMPRWLMTLSAAEISEAQRASLDIIFNGIASDGSDYQFQPLDYSQSADESRPTFTRETLQQRKREAFLRAGISMFNSRGYDHTSLDALAESLGVTKGAFYYHVASKPELLRQCVNHAFDLIETIYKENTQTPANGAQTLERFCRHLFFFQNSPPGPLIRYNLMSHLAEDDREQIQPRMETVLTQLATCFETGVSDGSLRSINLDVLRRIVMGMTLSCLNISHWVNREDSLNDQSLEYFCWLFRGLARTDGAQA